MPLQTATSTFTLVKDTTGATFTVSIPLVSVPYLLLITEKLYQIQQKQTCIRNKIYYNIKLAQKTKARFGRLQPPAWKWNKSIVEGVDK